MPPPPADAETPPGPPCSVKPSSAFLEGKQRMDVVVAMKHSGEGAVASPPPGDPSTMSPGSRKRDKFLIQYRLTTFEDARKDLADIFASKVGGRGR